MILVLGGSGFIGSRLCSRIAQSQVNFQIGDKLISQIYPQYTRVCDVRDLDSLRDLSINLGTIINLAAEHRDDVRPASLYDEVNVNGALNVCAFAEERGVNRIIFTSSVAVYGFAERGIDESGEINPFNDYGRTKYEAENVYQAWQSKDPDNRSLVIVRPTVVFGEKNRGNVYNLFRQIAEGNFLMVGRGENRKSLAYVENVAAFIEHCCGMTPGIYKFNYTDKPDFDMNSLIKLVKEAMGQKPSVVVRIPYSLGLLAGCGFDMVAKITGKQFSISSIRVEKFCKDSVYGSSLSGTGFVPPVDLKEAINRTIRYEFVDSVESDVFSSE